VTRPDFRRRQGARTRSFFLVLALASCVAPALSVHPQNPAAVFEIEIQDFGLSPTSNSELTIPSPSVSQVFVHLLRPIADDVDYSAIHASVNGKSAAQISEIVSGPRGKLIMINLKWYPNFAFVDGRNTVEVWAETRRGRPYYSSFVLRTATQNYNEDFIYHAQQSPGAKNSVPPELVLLEPERAVEFPTARNNLVVKISGVATSSTSIKRVLIDGKSVNFKATADFASRQLSRVTNLERRVEFQASVTIESDTTRIDVEAEDDLGGKTRLSIPVLKKRAQPLTQFSGRKYALIIGISRYRNSAEGIPDLEFADTDARSIYQFLQTRSGGQFAPEDMLLLINEQATADGIREALAGFISRASPDDLLLIFIAGHGAADPSSPQNYYVIANDTRVANISGTAIAMVDLRKYVERNVRAKRIVLLLDTCHSAGLSAETTRRLGNNLANLYLEKLLYQEEGRAIMTSSDVNEPSRESQKWGGGHGVFTYYVLEGLKGGADVDGDRLVSVGELFRYVRQHVRLDTEFRQNPRMLVGANENLTLAATRPQN